VIHVAAAVLAAASSAHYTTHVELRAGGQSVVVDGSGVVDGSARIGSLRFRMQGAKSGAGDAIVVSRTSLVAYIRGPKTGAPPGKPWGRFGGAYASPIYDAGVPLRLHAPRNAHVRLRVPRAEVALLTPVAPKANVTAEVWTDGRGRVVRLRATVRVTQPTRGSISIDERLDAFGTKVSVAEPTRDSVFVDLGTPATNNAEANRRKAFAILRNAETAIRAYAVDHMGYAGMTLAKLRAYDASVELDRVVAQAEHYCLQTHVGKVVARLRDAGDPETGRC
jgi:hypothetical protein